MIISGSVRIMANSFNNPLFIPIDQKFLKFFKLLPIHPWEMAILVMSPVLPVD